MPLESHSARVQTSSDRSDWATPRAFFNSLNNEFDFELDVCASPENAKLDHYITQEMDAFKAPWINQKDYPARCWMNPPYGRQINRWMELAFRWSLRGATVVCLVPNRAGSKWWRQWVLGRADEVRFVDGRLRFDDQDQYAPFESAVVIYRPPDQRKFTLYTHMGVKA